MKQKLIEDISYDELKHLIESYSANKIFLVSGKKSFELSGAKEFIELATKGKSTVRFSDFEQNPKYEQALKGTKLFLDSNCDAIIAIGGGSVMDMAKLINIFAANQEIKGLDIILNPKLIKSKGKTLVAIPTTAGTGSEATHFAVVYHNKKKYSVAHDFVLPDVVGLSYFFTKSQSKYLTACSGLDALSQAIESYWSVGANEKSKDFAKEAIELLVQNLDKAVISPNNSNREAVMKGAYLAGKAINITKTTAAHAISYAFTTYFSVPHGHAVFLTLPAFFVLNCEIIHTDINDTRGVEYVAETMRSLCDILKVNTPKDACAFLNSYAKIIGIETSLKTLGIIEKADIELIVESVNLERLKNNPVKIDSVKLRKVLT